MFVFQYVFAVVVPEDSDEHRSVKTLFDKFPEQRRLGLRLYGNADYEDKKTIRRILRVQSYFCWLRFNL